MGCGSSAVRISLEKVKQDGKEFCLCEYSAECVVRPGRCTVLL